MKKMKKLLLIVLMIPTMICVSQTTYTLDQNYNHNITQLEASVQTAAYRALDISSNKGFIFTKTAINDLMNQTNVEGIKGYFSINEDGLLSVVLVAIDGQANDILLNNKIKERGLCCTEVCQCGTSNSLNTN